MGFHIRYNGELWPGYEKRQPPRPRDLDRRRKLLQPPGPKSRVLFNLSIQEFDSSNFHLNLLLFSISYS